MDRSARRDTGDTALVSILHRLASAVAQAAEHHRQLYELALSALRVALHADGAGILLFDDPDTLRLHASSGLSETYRRAADGHASWPPGSVAPAPIVVPDVAQAAGLHDLQRASLAEGIRALAFIPIVGRGRLLGQFTVCFGGPRALSSVELEAAGTIASQIGFAIERHQADEQVQRLLPREQRARKEAEALLSVIQAAASTLDLTEAMRRMARALARVLQADMVGAYMADADRGYLRPVAGYRVPRPLIGAFLERPIPLRGHAVMEDLWANPRLLWTSDVAAHPLVDRAVIGRFPHQSDLFVPIVVEREPIGGFFCVWWRDRRHFLDEELRLVEEIGRQAALAVERARLFNEIEAANRAKDQFLAMLSHELRNPLSVISSSVAILDRSRSKSEPAIRTRQVIARQVHHLSGILDDLLDVARVTSGKIALARRALDLGDLARTTVMTLQQSAQMADRRVTTDLAPVWVDGDPTRLQQVVTNLLLNAVKFTGAGAHIHLAVEAEGGQAVLRVQDTGVGIAADILPRVFELFVQGPPAAEGRRGGLGLGLTLVQRLVELHGGTIRADSAGIGQGTTFTLRVPRIAPPAPASPVAERAPAAARRRVLIVEDNADGREMLAALLELEGHEVYCSKDGPGGVEQAAALHPDVAIVDIGLPGFDGNEVARRIRAGGRRVHLVALSGYGQAEDRRRGLAAGFDAYLVKPVTPETLRAALASGR